jgi:hypothetical protein
VHYYEKVLFGGLSLALTSPPALYIRKIFFSAVPPVQRSRRIGNWVPVVQTYDANACSAGAVS